MEHPIVAAVGSVRSTLKSVGDANPTFMTTDDKATALTELVRAEGQLAELRLRILADAGDLAVATATKDAAGWLANVTRTRFSDARADLALAKALDGERQVLATAMREGDATLAQAQVIHRVAVRAPLAHRRRHRREGRGAPRRAGRALRAQGARPPRTTHPRGRGTRDRRGGRSATAGRARGQCR